MPNAPARLVRLDTGIADTARTGKHLPEVWWYRLFAGTPDQIGSARTFLRQCLDGDPRTNDAVLCLSELAANAVLHSRSAQPDGTFGVRIRRAPGWLRVEVTDEGGPWQPRDHGETHGRGLHVVRSLADGVWIADTDIASPARTVAFEMGRR